VPTTGHTGSTGLPLSSTDDLRNGTWVWVTLSTVIWFYSDIFSSLKLLHISQTFVE